MKTEEAKRHLTEAIWEIQSYPDNMHDNTTYSITFTCPKVNRSFYQYIKLNNENRREDNRMFLLRVVDSLIEEYMDYVRDSEGEST